jgi:hypothetical protein
LATQQVGQAKAKHAAAAGLKKSPARQRLAGLAPLSTNEQHGGWFSAGRILRHEVIIPI